MIFLTNERNLTEWGANWLKLRQALEAETGQYY